MDMTASLTVNASRMKRLWSSPEFVDGQRIRKKKLDRRRRNTRRPRPFRRRPEGNSVAGARSERELLAPKVLSLFNEQDETITFVNSLRQELSNQGREVFLNFHAVQNFTAEALLLLKAVMDSPRRAPDTHTKGNLPSDPNVASEFKASGFFAGIARPPRDLPDAKGLMKKKSNTTVYSEQAAELVDFALKHVHATHTTETCAKACYRNLVEVMTNTHNHAANQRSSKRVRHGRERWHASVYCRNDAAYFSFVDLGVGILQNARVKRFLQKAAISISSEKRAVLLRDVFEGKIGSATEKPGRGRGLPRMKRDVDDGSLVDLHVLTSDVAGSVATLDFTSVDSSSLRGTAFRWQIGREES